MSGLYVHIDINVWLHLTIFKATFAKLIILMVYCLHIRHTSVSEVLDPDVSVFPLPSKSEPQPATRHGLPVGGSTSEGRHTGVTRSDSTTGEVSSTRAMSLLKDGR
ncbi:unnamed protein product [Boreogadus saida]